MHHGQTLIQGKPEEVRRYKKLTWEVSLMLEVEGIHTFCGLSHILFGSPSELSRRRSSVLWAETERARPPP
jgi:hypothetical protein